MTEEQRTPGELPEMPAEQQAGAEDESLFEQVVAEQNAAEPPAEDQAEDEAWEQALADENPLQAELDAAKAKADEYLAMAQRVQADFDNFRRRNANLRAEAFADGQREVATAMLNVLDNLERALASAGEDSPLRSGIELTLKQMTAVYEKLGVTCIDRLGEPFDPNLENAVLQGSPEEGEPGTVCQVLQKGYQMDGHVLRHAMVKVVAEA